jgi:hypothetical protein
MGGMFLLLVWHLLISYTLLYIWWKWCVIFIRLLLSFIGCRWKVSPFRFSMHVLDASIVYNTSTILASTEIYVYVEAQSVIFVFASVQNEEKLHPRDKMLNLCCFFFQRLFLVYKLLAELTKFDLRRAIVVANLVAAFSNCMPNTRG